MKRWAMLVAASALSGACAVGCSKGNASTATKPGVPGEPQTEASGSGDHKDEPEHDAVPKRVHLTAQVISAAKIQTAPVMREVLESVLELSGELSADVDKIARLTSPVAGRIDRITFAEGQTVKAGDVMVMVRVPDLADRQAALASASAKASAARSNAQRLEALAAKGLAAVQEVADARAQAAGIEAEATAAAERLRAIDMGASGRVGSLLALRAPMGGTVVARNAVVGQPADPDHPLATIADLTEAWFLGRVFENDLARVHIGATAQVQLNAYPKEHFEGKITLLGRQIDPVARTVVARIPLTNRQDLLRLGLFGIARISGGEGTSDPSLVVLRTALTEINGKPVVFVRHPDDHFELHEVVVGRSALGKVEVLSGLREGEQVVVAGAFTLKSLVLKATIAEEE